MSLINEALKKAQKQRTGEAPPLASMPAIGGESPTSIARTAKPTSPGNKLILQAGLGAAALLVVVAGAFFLVRAKPAAPAVPQTSPVTRHEPAPAATPAPAQAEPAKASPPAATAQPTVTTAKPPAPARASENVFVLPIVAPPAETAAPVANKVETAAGAFARAEPAQPVVPPPAAPRTPGAKIDPKAIIYIEGLRVAGIRASPTDPKDSKVLMNDRVYRIGNLVEAEMGLHLVGITADSLTFEDDHGGRYTRTF